ncbi:MAG: asparagine synthase (glutamine-hydrolyzing) [Chlamydiae bacterium RIFCSPHIGHO2_12_FULL_44_59]|nr:MAG: asparagine synthase (glutamine-hydrolyzing) [Chlamydiae bacterium RIFCSPHIGHO2_01_FULL_44_39]OGN60580.1 MAG: asparagine synthase (glutamine-hydrolyzing) [Chlamydiae bacterium RIFCSPHIGHO2_12_FULL_44_59]OGN66397.1 MAG: asparagine synthase (glutamine-hydrolyzing) [Chlamydiae bacterium RIFCSPLOWO2_01_FULL_44_52]OGN69446.1 MAG: asparagine synthase (glutamine-hydrolyzing) [Chlamydiae bacterium RIFCSPLOWO2_02_FULL_45_22]OGN70703.1 MAG: asparagine synthase (glutamine-hydrolyzing) [Chlamydiae b
MCGLTGQLIFDGNARTLQPSLLQAMTDTMKHRGPDGEGIWIAEDGKVGFGFRRLSIVDRSTSADQPMSSGSVHLVFNGEIYNHLDIRKELSHYPWKTDHSDTEALLHAYEEWGIDFVHKLRGMFAIALWDARTKELWLIRDRIGIKPLYYSVHSDYIHFASEIKALLQNPEQKRAVHEEALYHYLSFSMTPAPQTLFDGIQKLSPGTWLRIRSDGSMLEKRYWDVWDHTNPLIGHSEEEVAEKILSELRIAVNLRKMGDVPIGVFLSGGIDSSTNAALFSENSPPIKTFSIGYQGDYASCKNELLFAKRMAKEVGAMYHEKLLTVEDLIDFLPKMIHLQDEPIADPVCVPVYYVSKLARENGVIVAQVGEGADELFFGYPSWKNFLKLQKMDHWPVPRLLKKMGLFGLRKCGKGASSQYEWLRRGAEGLPIFWGGVEAFTEVQKKRLLSPRLQEKFKTFTSWEAIQPIYRRFQEKAWEPSILHWMSYMDLNMRLPELLLMRVDKMSMGVSLEGRVPFLDHKFVELAMSIPEAMKTKNGVSKYILKKAVRGIIPDELIDRPKQGFGVPIYEWLYGKLGDQMRKELEFFCKETDFFNRDEVMSYFDRGYAAHCWYLFNLALWWKQFIFDQPVHNLLWNCKTQCQLPAVQETDSAPDVKQVLCYKTYERPQESGK